MTRNQITVEELQTKIGTWASETFPNHDARSISLHLLREAVELAKSVHVSDADVRETIRVQLNKSCVYPPRQTDEEVADVAILLFTLADYKGVALEMAVEAKHAVNLVRAWGEPDHQGIAEHADSL